MLKIICLFNGEIIECKDKLIDYDNDTTHFCIKRGKVYELFHKAWYRVI